MNKKPRVFNISRVVCSNLSKVDLLGKNDPYVVFEISDQKCRTRHMDNAGADATFDNLDLAIWTDKSVIREQNMTVSVYDFNDVRADILIVSTRANLSYTRPH
jgi:Ca2+-dependent lipid-binding protein